ncbi:hypothetical protein RSK20926_10054 [Roseobacter sp. SK209-2-6]|nr:hypothetical protein RSK20926_10054 [Roseobacter sp. SK209-2-6]
MKTKHRTLDWQNLIMSSADLLKTTSPPIQKIRLLELPKCF